ncbi:MAG TPA: Calx-beta domain-containing protein, partial [Candidatus Heimdallarchaeota archaeon]|nr:Calx-beta domain-containing protein [Candidatus Heimdallarchaeota archaeon]
MFFKRNVGRGLSFFTKSLFVLGLFCFLLSGYAAAQHTISGRITEGGSGLTGVTLTGLPNSPILTDGTGFYTDTVPDGWSGTVTPGLAGYTFTPESIDYTNVTADFLDQDYTASVSVQFSASSSIGDEGDTPAILEIFLSAVSNLDVSVNYAVSGGDALGGGVDYTLSSGSATIFSGNTTSNDISIAVVEDFIDEFDETIVVDLSVPVNADLGVTDQHTYTINDNDAPPTVGFSLTESSENEGVGTANLLVMLSELSGLDVEVDYSVSGGTATGGGVDYTLTPNTLTIPAGSLSANIPVAINDDVLPEAAETVIVALSDPLYATLGTDEHTLTIIDNEAFPTVQFSSSASNDDEGTTPVDIQLTLLPASGTDVTVNFTTGGTATGADYTVATPSPITILAGNTSANITLNVVDDAEVEGN